MERAILVMNRFAEKVNECRANGRYDRANEYMNMLCGAMCVFNEYEADEKLATLEEVNNNIKVVIVNPKGE